MCVLRITNRLLLQPASSVQRLIPHPRKIQATRVTNYLHDGGAPTFLPSEATFTETKLNSDEYSINPMGAGSVTASTCEILRQVRVYEEFFSGIILNDPNGTRCGQSYPDRTCFPSPVGSKRRVKVSVVTPSAWVMVPFVISCHKQ